MCEKKMLKKGAEKKFSNNRKPEGYRRMNH